MSNIFIINGILESNRFGKNEDNLTDVILDVDVSDEYYKLKGLNEEECPKDAWTVWVTQNDEDRKEKSVWVSLCNEGIPEDEYVEGKEKEMILQYVRSNEVYNKENLTF